MKKSFYLSLRKPVALMGMAAIALFGTASTLTSCGGGGNSATEQEIALRQLMVEQYMVLAKSGANGIEIYVGDQIGRTNSYMARVTWGEGGTVSNGMLSVKRGSVEYDDKGHVKKLVFDVSSFSEQITTCPGFVGFWSINKNYTGVSVLGMTVTATDIVTEQGVSSGNFVAISTFNATDATAQGSPSVGPEEAGAEGSLVISSSPWF